MHYSLLILFLGITIYAPAQTLGGNAVFNFLRLSATPQQTALGGFNISQPSEDVGLAFQNPAQLTSAMHTQMNTVFTSQYAGIKAYHLCLGYRNEPLKTNFLGGLYYLDYGSTTQTDASGNVQGSFRPADWVMQLSASRSYQQRWNFGMSIKFISSSYGPYRSNGIAADAGLKYQDTTHLLTASVLLKNAGTQLKKYDGASEEDLPFDLQAGISKRLNKAPFGFSLTARHLHRFNIRFEDTAFNNENGFPGSGEKKFSAGKILDHLILSTTLYIGDHVECYAGYNFLRRRELNIGTEGNGLNGFSLGAAVLLGKIHIRYAQAYYQSGTAFHQFGLNLKLNEYFGLGKFGERAGW